MANWLGASSVRGVGLLQVGQLRIGIGLSGGPDGSEPGRVVKERNGAEAGHAGVEASLQEADLRSRPSIPPKCGRVVTAGDVSVNIRS